MIAGSGSTSQPRGRLIGAVQRIVRTASPVSDDAPCRVNSTALVRPDRAGRNRSTSIASFSSPFTRDKTQPCSADIRLKLSQIDSRRQFDQHNCPAPPAANGRQAAADSAPRRKSACRRRSRRAGSKKDQVGVGNAFAHVSDFKPRLSRQRRRVQPRHRHAQPGRCRTRAHRRPPARTPARRANTTAGVNDIESRYSANTSSVASGESADRWLVRAPRG